MKKGISVLLAFVLLCCTLCVGTVAADAPETFLGEKRTYTVDRKDPNTVKSYASTAMTPLKKRGTADADTPFTYYSTLSENAKAIYNAVVSVQNPEQPFEVVLPYAYSFRTYVSSNGEFEVQPSVLEACANDIYQALTAVIFDHPEQFWLAAFSVQEYYEGVPTYGNWYDMSLVSLEFELSLPTGYSSWDAVKADYNQMMQVAKTVTADGTTRFEKLKTLHDWVAKAVDYDDNFGELSYYAVPVFLGSNGSKVVCEGYSEAFKILCDLAGIPCIIAVSNTHEWNHVKMEDGNWYAVDVTWDDKSDLYYDFFLVGSQTKNIHFDKIAFSADESHIYTGNLFADYSLSCPALSANAYLPMFLGANSAATVNKSTKTVYLASGDTVLNALQAASDTTFSVSQDGKTLTIYQGATVVDTYNIQEFVAGFGDVNGDGKVNAVDARFVLQASSGARTLTAEQSANADVNGDGKVNAVDARWILQVASGARILAA